jgi:hypothetical protein
MNMEENKYRKIHSYSKTNNVSDVLSIHHQELKTAHTATGPKHVEYFTRITKLRDWCILLVLLQEYITMHGPMNVKKIKTHLF